MLETIIAAIVIGIIAGYLGRLLLPARTRWASSRPSSFGIVGALVGWALFTYVLGIGDRTSSTSAASSARSSARLIVLILLRAIRDRGGSGTPASRRA
jgi:uncharacterized membrane protein YeaQ/YmgE (transglycosylase-associated protein family)